MKDYQKPLSKTPSALVYCRISTGNSAEGTSLESQKAACISLATQLGYTVARVTEEVFSAAELYGRPKLARDRADIRAGMFQALVVYAIDRLSRDTAHLPPILAPLRRGLRRTRPRCLNPPDELSWAFAGRRHLSSFLPS